MDEAIIPFIKRQDKRIYNKKNGQERYVTVKCDDISLYSDKSIRDSMIHVT